MKIYTDRSRYCPKYRTELADILRPYIKDKIITVEGRRIMYGNWVDVTSPLKTVPLPMRIMDPQNSKFSRIFRVFIKMCPFRIRACVSAH